MEIKGKVEIKVCRFMKMFAHLPKFLIEYDLNCKKETELTTPG